MGPVILGLLPLVPLLLGWPSKHWLEGGFPLVRGCRDLPH